jgi:hypothetical protein
VCPKFSQKKAVLQNYLTQHNIPFSANDTKKVLYEKIKQKKTTVVYKTANLYGHEVYCELNPKELIFNVTFIRFLHFFSVYYISTRVVIRVIIITKINDNRFYDTSIYVVFFVFMTSQNKQTQWLKLRTAVLDKHFEVEYVRYIFPSF